MGKKRDWNEFMLEELSENDNENGNSNDNDNANSSDDDDELPISQLRKKRRLNNSSPWEDGLRDILDDLQNRREPFNGKHWKALNEKTKLKTVINLFKRLKRRKKGTKYEIFAKLALDMIRKPDGNGGIERFFNPVRHLHDWERNRLSPEMLDAMLYICINEKCLVRKGLLVLK